MLKALEWSTANNAVTPVGAIVYNTPAAVLEDNTADAAFYSLSVTQLTEGNPIDTDRVFRFRFARNLPDITSTLILRFNGAGGSNNDLYVDPIAGTATAESSIELLDVNITDASIEVEFRHLNGGYTTLRIHPVYGPTGGTTQDNALTGKQFLLDYDIDHKVGVVDNPSADGSGGYIDYPNGTRVQWGAATGSGSRTVTMPMSFINAEYNVIVNAGRAGTSVRRLAGWDDDSRTANTFVCDAYAISNVDSAAVVYWQATGRWK